MDWQGRSDGQLLTAFAKAHDEAAFEEIVRRHATMVFNVCRRTVGNAQDAEDASQAVFLALARKADRLSNCASVAPWLHHVSCCVSSNLRKSRAIRLRHQEKAASMAEPIDEGAGQRDEIRNIV